MLSELYSLNLKLCIKQYNKNFLLHLIVVPQQAMAGDKLLNQNKAGRPHQLVVYVFSYVYGGGLSTVLISVVNSPLPDDQSICQPPSNFGNFSITI